MTLRRTFAICTAALWIATSVGCKATSKRDAEVDTLLRAVSYDTTVPPVEQGTPIEGVAPSSPVSSGISIKEKASSVGQIVTNGLKATAGLVLLGGFKIVESALGLDDDDDIDGSTPRGRADRSFNGWVDDRERWRSSE